MRIPDIESFLCKHLASLLDDVRDLQVDVREPDEYDGSHPLIVVRDDGGTPSGRVLIDTDVGVTVRGWTREDSRPCRELACRVFAILTDDPGILEGHAAGSPILSVEPDGCTTPTPVTEDSDVCRYYMTVEYHIGV